MSFNAERAARALASTLLCSDAEAARRAGVTGPTIANWRKRLETDGDLLALYKRAVLSLDDQWRRGLEDVAAQAASDLGQIQAKTHALVMDLLEHPEAHGDEVDGVMRYPSTMERLSAASQAMGDLRMTLEKSSEMLTHYAAIVAEPAKEATHGAAQTPGADGSPAAGSGPVEGRPTAVH